MVKKNWRKRKFLIKKKNTYKLLFLLILGMTLGFAAITTTLKFTGTVNVAKTTWDIHWENPKRLGGVSAIKDAALKDGDNTIVEYQVNLEDPGDYYEFTVKAVNSGTIDAMVTGVSNKVYDTNNVEQNPSFIDFKVTYGDGIAIEDNHKLKSGKSETYKVRVLYKEGLAADQFPDAETTYKFVFQVTYAQEDETTSTDRGTNITAWTYNEDSTAENYCINGEEATCKNTDCYKSGKTCEMGTVIKYKVNSTDYKYFYVLKDDGETITMQQRENTVRNIAWHAGENNNSQGPDTILPALEQATRNWTNVNTIEYTPGTAPFANTGCTYNSGTSGDYKPVCGTNTYTMSVRKARARMITVLEASATGCLVWKDGSQYTNIMGNSINAYNEGSCPDYMHNYLYQSTSYGGSYNDNTTNEVGTYDYGYWTLSARSGYSANAWLVGLSGYLYSDPSSLTNYGARAVVEISK